jgi:hypothetical protein
LGGATVLHQVFNIHDRERPTGHHHSMRPARNDRGTTSSGQQGRRTLIFRWIDYCHDSIQRLWQVGTSLPWQSFIADASVGQTREALGQFESLRCPLSSQNISRDAPSLTKFSPVPSHRAYFPASMALRMRLPCWGVEFSKLQDGGKPRPDVRQQSERWRENPVTRRKVKCQTDLSHSSA